VLLRNFETLASMLRWSFLQHLLSLHPFESIWTRASKYFWTERLRRVFTFGSMYMGMSPFDAPGTYSLLQYTELAEGVWYPVGGFHRVVEALVEIGKRFGVEYRLGTGVEAILLDAEGARAKGVRLENGEVLEADIVVNNSDLVYAYNELLPKSSYADSLSQRPGSCSSISFYWALSEKVPALQPHNIFLADDYRESFDSIFKKQLIPDEPSFYVNVPSRIDPTAAPATGDSVVVLVPVGHLVETQNGTTVPQNTNGPSIASASPAGQTGISPSSTQDWPAMIALARKTILHTIKSRTGVDLAPLIKHELTNDPNSWRDRFNLDKGAILGLSHSFFNVLSFRPSTRARRPHWIDGKLGGGVAERVASVVIDTTRGKGKDVQGLYMVGASAHPGTGVPIVLAGGRLVAEQILEDLGLQRPWGNEERKVRDERLDTIDKPFWLDDSRSWIFVIAMVMAVPWVFGAMLWINL
jgi:phytoene desaturase (3,4-didehydrolycopene-forming)